MQLKTCRKNFCNSALCSRVFLVFVHQNRLKLLLSKKSSTIPGKIFRDVDVRPLEQSCLAQHVLSVLRDEQTLTNVDKRKHEMRKRRIEQQRISNLEVVESDKNWPTTADLRSGCQTRRLKKDAN